MSLNSWVAFGLRLVGLAASIGGVVLLFAAPSTRSGYPYVPLMLVLLGLQVNIPASSRWRTIRFTLALAVFLMIALALSSMLGLLR